MIETKLKMLDIKEKESKRILERGKIKEIERHANEIEIKVEEIQDLKGKAQELMLESDKETEEVNEWTYKIEGELEKHGQPLENLQKLLKELQTANKLEKIRKKESIEEQRKQKR